MLKRILKVFLIVVIVIAVLAGAGIFYITRGLSSGEQLVINAVDLADIDDGVYAGRYDSWRFSNQLEVTVSDHRITSVKVAKDMMVSTEDVKKSLFDEVIARQNTDVEVISGATVSSKAYLKAIENALKK